MPRAGQPPVLWSAQNLSVCAAPSPGGFMPTVNFDPDHLFQCPVCGYMVVSLYLCIDGSYACQSCIQLGMAEPHELTVRASVTFTIDTGCVSCYTPSDRRCKNDTIEETPESPSQREGHPPA